MYLLSPSIWKPVSTCIHQIPVVGKVNIPELIVIAEPIVPAPAPVYEDKAVTGLAVPVKALVKYHVDAWVIPADIPVRFAPEIAGKVPVKLAAGKLVRLAADTAGNVPESFDELEKLPGVGHKTASVVMSQGFGHPAFPVDTHIHRLAQRWGLTSGKNVTQTEKDLKKIFPRELWNRLHLQIIFYGREFCTARSCFGLICEICKTCYPKRKMPIKTQKP